MSNLDYAILKGNLLLADRDPVTGLPGSFSDVGEVPVWELDPSVEFKDNYSTSKDSPNEQDAHVAVQRTLTGSMTLKEKTAANLELILHGTKSQVVSGSVTLQSFESGILAGDIRLLPGRHVAVSSLIIKDSTSGTPLTLTLGTDYTVDLDYGVVTFVNLGAYVQPFKASYSYAARNDVTILSKTVTNKAMLFEGLNLANGKKERFLLHNVTIDPASKVPGKSEDFNTYDLKFTVLKDPTKLPADALGQYGVHNLLS